MPELNNNGTDKRETFTAQVTKKSYLNLLPSRTECQTFLSIFWNLKFTHFRSCNVAIQVTGKETTVHESPERPGLMMKYSLKRISRSKRAQ